jgi:hypothetical protein
MQCTTFVVVAERETALDIATKNFQRSWEVNMPGRENRNRAAQWADLNTRRLRVLVAQMEAGGGHGGRA